MLPEKSSSSIQQSLSSSRQPASGPLASSATTNGRRMARRARRLDSTPLVYCDATVPRGAADIWLFMRERFPSSKREGKCWPSVQTLATAMHVSVRTVQYRLRRLEKAGWLTITTRRRRTNEYNFRTPAAVAISVEGSDKACTQPRAINCTQNCTLVPSGESSLREDSPSGRETRASDGPFSSSEAHSRRAKPKVVPLSPSGWPPDKQRLIDQWREFLSQWPRDRRGVDAGFRLWSALINSGELDQSNIEEVFSGLVRWKNSDQWFRDAGRYIPAIEGWLQRRAWKDFPRQQDVDSWR